MTQATQTTLGTIKLAGDLAGSNDANTPTLTSTGVTPGSYVFPSITVDGKGRITAATSGAPEDIADIIPGASKTQKGIAQIGDNIEVTETTTQGYYSIGYGATLVGGAASGLDYDPSRPYTAVISASSVNNTTVSIVTDADGFTVNELIAAFNAQLSWNALSLVGGNLRLVPPNTGAGSFVSVVSDALFKYIDGYTGVITSDFGKDSNTIWVKEASVSDFGVIKVGSGLTISNGILSFDSNQINKATNSTLGIVKIGDGLTVSAGVVSADLSTVQIPIATNSVLGAVKIGSGLSVLGDGTISADLPLATTSTKGGVIVGSNINVSSGTISIPNATYASKGVIKVGSGLTVDGNGVVDINASLRATSTTHGLVKIGSGLLVTNGVVSVDTSNIPSASKSAKGAVKIGSNIDVSAGVISVPVASSTVIGVSKIDTSVGFFITGDGYLSLTTAAISASPTQLGMVKIGSGISVSNGTISVTSPDATTSTKGIVQIGAGLSVTGGVVSASNATTNTKGIVQVGSGLTVSNGIVSTVSPDATTSVKGLVQIGSNINVSSGVISIPTATETVAGVVKIGAGISINNGLISVAPENFPVATSSTLGMVKVGSGLSMTSGSLGLALATNSTVGVVKPGYGLSVQSGSGVISADVPFATETGLGIVKIGNGLTVVSGVVSASVPNATTSAKGIVQIGSGLSVTNGVVSVNISSAAYPSTNNNWTKGQIITPSAATISSNALTPDLLASNILRYTVSGNRNIDVSNPVMTSTINGETVEHTGIWTVSFQYAGNNTSTFASWGTVYKFAAGTPPTFNGNGNLNNHFTRVLTFIAVDQNTILVKDEGNIQIQ